jgi:hypothetical protein
MASGGKYERNNMSVVTTANRLSRIGVVLRSTNTLVKTLTTVGVNQIEDSWREQDIRNSPDDARSGGQQTPERRNMLLVMKQQDIT